MPQQGYILHLFSERSDGALINIAICMLFHHVVLHSTTGSSIWLVIRLLYCTTQRLITVSIRGAIGGLCGSTILHPSHTIASHTNKFRI